MLGLFVPRQTSLCSGLVVTLVTAVHHSIMLCLLVFSQTSLLSGLVVALVTIMSNSFVLALQGGTPHCCILLQVGQMKLNEHCAG